MGREVEIAREEKILSIEETEVCDTARKRSFGAVLGCRDACTAASVLFLCPGKKLGERKGGAR